MVRPSRLRKTSPTSRSSKNLPCHSFGAATESPTLVPPLLLEHHQEAQVERRSTGVPTKPGDVRKNAAGKHVLQAMSLHASPVCADDAVGEQCGDLASAVADAGEKGLPIAA